MTRSDHSTLKKRTLRFTLQKVMRNQSTNYASNVGLGAARQPYEKFLHSYVYPRESPIWFPVKLTTQVSGVIVPWR